MKKINPITVFWLLIGFFLLILGQFFVPVVTDFFRGTLLFLSPFIIFSLLGVILVITTIKQKVKKPLRKFLILTGISAALVFVGILLHNLIYALFIQLFGSDFWTRTGLGDEPFFFLLALIIAPVGFLIGTIGSLISIKKSR